MTLKTELAGRFRLNSNISQKGVVFYFGFRYI
jgi:hypothetical protein